MKDVKLHLTWSRALALRGGGRHAVAAATAPAQVAARGRGSWRQLAAARTGGPIIGIGIGARPGARSRPQHRTLAGACACTPGLAAAQAGARTNRSKIGECTPRSVVPVPDGGPRTKRISRTSVGDSIRTTRHSTQNRTMLNNQLRANPVGARIRRGLAAARCGTGIGSPLRGKAWQQPWAARGAQSCGSC